MVCISLIPNYLWHYFFITFVRIPKTLLINVALVSTFTIGFIAVLFLLEDIEARRFAAALSRVSFSNRAFSLASSASAKSIFLLSIP